MTHELDDRSINDTIIVGGCQQGITLIRRSELAAYNRGYAYVAALAGTIAAIAVLAVVILA
jgi:hypothetical protein